jgi:hypothetical protein
MKIKNFICSITNKNRNFVFSIIFFISIIFSSCSVGSPVYPAIWSTSIKNAPIESYTGIYHDSLASILEFQTSDITSSKKCFNYLSITNSLKINLFLKCIDTNDTITSIELFPKNSNFKIEQNKNGIKITYFDTKHLNFYFLLSKANDGSFIIKKYESIPRVYPLLPLDVYTWYRIDSKSVKVIESYKDGKKLK